MQNLGILFPFSSCLAVSVPVRVHGVSLDKRESTMKAGVWVGVWLSIKIQDKDESLTTDLNITCLATFGAYLLERSSNQGVHDDNVGDRHPLAQSFYLGLATKLNKVAAKMRSCSWAQTAEPESGKAEMQRRRTDDPPVHQLCSPRTTESEAKVGGGRWGKGFDSSFVLHNHHVVALWVYPIQAIRTW
jgi:hypothetical protein